MRRSAILVFVLVLAVLSSCADAPRGTEFLPVTAWRLLANEHGTGGPPSVRVIADDDDYRTTWSDLGLTAKIPPVDWNDEIVVAFTVSYPSGCEYPFLSLNLDHATRTISPHYGGNEPAVCAADVNPYTVIVAIDRESLMVGSYEVRLTTVSPEVADATAAFINVDG